MPIEFTTLQRETLTSIFRAMPRVECVDTRKCLSCKA